MILPPYICPKCGADNLDISLATIKPVAETVTTYDSCNPDMDGAVMTSRTPGTTKFRVDPCGCMLTYSEFVEECAIMRKAKKEIANAN
jgi:hypothetical protein